MKVNLHTHTPRCMHAVGSEEEYVRAAIDEGMDILGFSDHAPHPFPDGFVSGCKMGMELLDDYVSAVLNVRKAYEGKIQIPLGLEMEYYPGLYQELMAKLRDLPMDYLILGQHFLGNEVGQRYVGAMRGGDEFVEAYCRQSMEAMNTGVFTYFAHPDLVWFDRGAQVSRQWIRDLCRESKACGLPLEVNLLGVREGRHYPNPEFWRIAAEEDCQVIIGWDAHTPKHLDCPEAVETARKMICELDLKLMDNVALTSVK